MNPELAVKTDVSAGDLASPADDGTQPQPQESPAKLLVEGSAIAPVIDSAKATSAGWQFWQVFSSTFITIFLAELGDKTQVSTLLMSAKFHNPWVIFAGAASALISTSLLGVWFGCWLSSRISPQVLDKAAGVMMALLSVWLLVEVVQG